MIYNPRSNDSCFLLAIILLGILGLTAAVIGMAGLYALLNHLEA